MTEPASVGPHLQMAVICERVLQEVNGVLSVIRVIDRLTFTPPMGASPTMPAQLVTLNAVILFRSDQARGRGTVTLRPQRPSGFNMPEMNFPVLFEGEDRGSQFILDLVFPAEEEGLYWFDVLLDGKLISRMPLRIVYAPISVGIPPPGDE